MTYTFATVARMEWIKLRSLRSVWWLLVASLLAMVAIGAGVGIGYRGHVTGEYSSGTIRATLAAVPRRRLVLAAKTAVYGAAAVLAGLIASAAGYLAGQVAIAGSPVPHSALAEAGRPLLRTAVYLGLIGLIGVGLGALVRHSGGAIGLLFAGLFVPMIVAGMFGEAGIPVSRLQPVLMLLNTIAVVTPTPGMLGAWLSTAVMAGYAVIAIGLGTVVLTRRDA
jgi:hypothetical protein